MTKSVTLKSYLRSISDIVLPEPFSETTSSFIDFVVNAHSWYKGTHAHFVNHEPDIAFNFYIGPGHIVDNKDTLKEVVRPDFQNLKYGVPSAIFFQTRHIIPREIYDAGLVFVPGDYKSDYCISLMEKRIANMLEAINEYRSRFPSTIFAKVES